jgi:GTP pyrophosphokinase
MKIKEAYFFAKKAHEGQWRINGEQYFKHPERMFELLKTKNVDSEVLCAALLHDLVEDTPVTLNEIKKKFGEEIGFLVDGMTKIKGDLEGTARKFEKYSKKDRRLLLIKHADLEENLSVLDFVKIKEKEKVKNKYLRFIDLLKRLSRTKLEKSWINELSKKAKKKFRG